ncbi:MAG: hypothetical protein KDE46_10575 [Caldilineaceae bacterium]|nr:hypothetical protein [Caldilineaceae bacterium]
MWRKSDMLIIALKPQCAETCMTSSADQAKGWAKMWGQLQNWREMLRFGAGRVDLLQNSPQ